MHGSLKVVYRRMGSASQLLQGALIDLAAATVLRNCMTEVKKCLKQNVDLDRHRLDIGLGLLVW